MGTGQAVFCVEIAVIAPPLIAKRQVGGPILVDKIINYTIFHFILGY